MTRRSMERRGRDGSPSRAMGTWTSGTHRRYDCAFTTEGQRAVIGASGVCEFLYCFPRCEAAELEHSGLVTHAEAHSRVLKEVPARMDEKCNERSYF
ncbi:unnamed protein product [Plutella xylostella]|uniref:(diamondback moth) hypothetical protein n=1 Tax=Plutella xylostella TaxID=51655 RepID=A0A8S4D5K0_PLUXY|nr:unnamed protein product [Plutella xylostella]